MAIRHTIMVWSLWLVLCLLTGSTAKYLLVAAPDGGLWGARVDPSDPSKLLMTEQVGYPQRGMYYGAVYHDSKSQTLLMEMNDAFGDFHGLAVGPVCSIMARLRPEVLLAHVMLVDHANQHLSGCGEDCRWSAFGMNDGRIYFVMAGQYGQDAGNLDIIVRLRALEGCEGRLPNPGLSPVRGYGDHIPFSVNDCSTNVADVIKIPLKANADIRTGKHLAIVEGDQLQFYFQMSQSSYIGTEGFKVETMLYRVTESGVKKVIDKVTNVAGVHLWQKRTQGGVVASDQVVCHAIFDSIRCAEPGSSHFVTVLDPATKESICGAESILEGLALDDLHQQLYFGCSSLYDDGTSSGSGLLDLGSRQAEELTDGLAGFSAANLVLVEELSQDCP